MSLRDLPPPHTGPPDRGTGTVDAWPMADHPDIADLDAANTSGQIARVVQKIGELAANVLRLSSPDDAIEWQGYGGYVDAAGEVKPISPTDPHPVSRAEAQRLRRKTIGQWLADLLVPKSTGSRRL
jgi:hypothetical protein